MVAVIQLIEGNPQPQRIYGPIPGIALQIGVSTLRLQFHAIPAGDCLAGYLYTCQRDGDIIPAPSQLSDPDLQAVARELDPDTSVCEGIVNMVSVDVAAYAKQHFEKSVRKTLTIPAWLNTAAREMNLNFSQVLQEALLAKVQTRQM